jgi:hypothetical protein
MSESGDNSMGNPSAGEPSGNQSGEKLIGLDHWNAVRAQFTQNHKSYNPHFDAAVSYKDNPLLSDVEPGHFDTIYQSMVTGRRFQNNVPLSFVMLVIRHGWRKEGLVISLI